MPKRTRKSARGVPRAVLVLIATTLVLLAIGEVMLLSRTDSWRLFSARNLGWGDPARVTRWVGLQVREGLRAAAIPADSIHEGSDRDGRVAWRVGVPADASLLQVNYAITQAIGAKGAEVLSGSERAGRNGATVVTLELGLPHRPTHEITLVRAPRIVHGEPAAAGRVALVLYGFGEDSDDARATLDLPLPFAVALPAGDPGSVPLFHEARTHDREVVLHLPLEPINFPQVNPGPGTILVTMKPVKISGLVRHYLDEAGPVAAVANHMGSLATQDMTVMRAVYQELRKRRLPFLHVTPAAGSVCKPLAADLGVEYEQPDLVLDAEARAKDTRLLDARWNEILARARRRGEAVVLLRATPLARSWLPRALASKRLSGVSLVTLESLLRKPVVL